MKYDAFISYRHAELDSEVAADVQKRLERYRIPKAIRKKTGKQKIERVFRDKEELPTTFDLNDDIGNALKNSDFLIVICSPRLKESVWCLKEIETFLAYHDRNHVLTVLAEGEPYDVIPDILLYEDVEGPDGTVIKKTIEPLSCDYRLKKSKRVKEELPRLAAMVIGCSYNDLIQRQKQYRQRRLTAIFAGALVIVVGFLIFAVRSNIKINENYNKSLVNQSLYLTEISQTLLDKGDREGAIKTALAALPSEDNERPLVNEPLYALNNALYSYQFATQTNFNAVKNIESQAEPSDKIVFNENTKTYAMIDNAGYGYIADESLEIFFEAKPGDISESDTVDFREVCAYGDGFIFFDENAFYYISSSGEVVYSAAYAEGEDPACMAWCVNNDTVVIADKYGVKVFDAKDGSLTDEKEIADESGYEPDIYPGICFSPSGDTFAVYAVGILTDGGYLYTYDLKTGDFKHVMSETDIQNACFADENTIALIVCDYMSMDYYYSTYDTTVVKCINADSGEILWEAEESSLHNKNEEKQLSLYTWTDTGKTSLQLTSGNELKLFDPENGESLFCMNYESQIVKTYEKADGSWLIVLNNGSVWQQLTDDGKYILFGRGGINADAAGAGFAGESGILLGCDDDRRYTKLSIVADTSVSVLEDELPIDYLSTGGDIAQTADIPNYISLEYEADGEFRMGIKLWNADTLEPVFDYATDKEDCSFLDVTPVYRDGELYVSSTESDGISSYYHLFKVSSGEEITKEGGVPFDEYAAGIWLKNSDLICVCSWNDGIVFYDLEGNIVKEIAGEEGKAYSAEGTLESGDFLGVEVTDDWDMSLRLMNTETYEWVEFEDYGSSIPLYEYGTYAYAYNHNKLLAYTNDRRLLVFDAETGKIETEIPFGGSSNYDFAWFDNDSKLILSGDDNYIKLWDLEKNELISQEAERTEAASINGSVSSEFFTVTSGGFSTMSTEKHYIYQVDEDGSMHKYAYVENGVLNEFNEKVIITSASDEIGITHIYSLEELQKKAKAVIEDTELTEEEKEKYFIN